VTATQTSAGYTPPPYTPSSVGTITYYSKSVGTISASKTTSTLSAFTGAAGRVAVGVEMAAAAAGLVAAFL
jgi:hypothetical protein